MRSQEIADRYAYALYDIASEKGIAEDLEHEYYQVLSGIADVPELANFLANPLISRTAKHRVVEQIFPDISEYLRNLIFVLVRNSREGYLRMICESFVRLRADAAGITRIKIEAAKPLDSENRIRLEERLSEVVGGKIELDEKVDANLLGGIRIEIDGRVADGTLRARLNRLRSQLAG